MKKLMNQFRNVKLFICDECSMVSNILLLFIHLRLEEVFAERQRISGTMTETTSSDRVRGLNYDRRNWYGGQNILMTGDFMQLQPVNAKHCFEPLTPSDIRQAGGGLPLRLDLMKQFDFYELLQNMRQGGDLMWAEMLDRMRIGNVTKEDASVLKPRIIQNFKVLLPGPWDDKH